MIQTLSWRIAVCILNAAILLGQQNPGWIDNSAHVVQLVKVADGVELEVLDWGGTGRPIVLLAGYLTAHAYDEFAPQLTKIGHVYGITRRGLGASSKPESGYDAKQSAKDILQVLAALKIVAPVLVGHSFGGQDLTTLGANDSYRLAGLVYLNSAEDSTLKFSDYGVAPVEGNQLPASLRNRPAADFRSIAAYRAWQMETEGVVFPEAELRQLFAINADGRLGDYLPARRVRDAMFAGVQKPDYARIRVPVLAFFSALPPLEQQLQKYPPQNARERAAMEQQFKVNQAIHDRHIRDLKAGVPAAKVVVVAQANFYIFLSSQTELLKELSALLKSLN